MVALRSLRHPRTRPRPVPAGGEARARAGPGGEAEGKTAPLGRGRGARGPLDTILTMAHSHQSVWLAVGGTAAAAALALAGITEPSTPHASTTLSGPTDSWSALNCAIALVSFAGAVRAWSIPLARDRRQRHSDTSAPEQHAPQLFRGWFADDGGISHAVAETDTSKSLCDKPSPSLRPESGHWETSPSPRCQRCLAEANRRESRPDLR
jgi:hypothetical protein